LDPDAGLMKIGSLYRTHSFGFGGAARLKGFGSALLPHPSNLGEVKCSRV